MLRQPLSCGPWMVLWRRNENFSHGSSRPPQPSFRCFEYDGSCRKRRRTPDRRGNQSNRPAAPRSRPVVNINPFWKGTDMSSNSTKLIAVIGGTGQQGGAVVRALQAQGQFKVRALTRNPDKHRGLADEVVEADLDRPETLKAAFAGAYGVFLVTNFWEQGTDELTQATAAVRAAKEAGVKHFIWSTLPDVEAISGGKFHVPHFTGKAKVDSIVKAAGVASHTFVIAPFYFQNLAGVLGPQKQPDGSLGWAVPLNPDVRCIHMGDINELGLIVTAAFLHADEVGNGQYLPFIGDFLSFNEIVETLNQQGHKLSVKQIPTEVFATFFPGAAEIAEMFNYFQAHTYLGSDSSDRIALATKIAGRQPTKFSTWARLNFPVQNA